MCWVSVALQRSVLCRTGKRCPASPRDWALVSGPWEGPLLVGRLLLSTLPDAQDPARTLTVCARGQELPVVAGEGSCHSGSPAGVRRLTVHLGWKEQSCSQDR